MGDYLSAPVKSKEIVEGEGQSIRFAACGMQGWRKNMEDAHLCEMNIAPDVSLFGVFDGHGGTFTVLQIRILGQEVALYVKKHFKDFVKGSSHFHKGDYANALKDAFIKVDETLKTTEGKKELIDISTNISKSQGSYGRPEAEELAMNIGCTACVALITKKEIYVANAGDSRGVLCRKGVAIAMSEDHKPELDRERKRIEKAGATVEDGRVNGILNLSRSLGDLEYKLEKKLSAAEQAITSMPEVKVEKVTDDTEFLILACDGLWDCLTNEKAVALVREKAWNSSTNKPIKAKLGKVIGDILDSILAVDLDNPDNSSYGSHKKKLEEIKEGRHKSLQKKVINDPSMELSKINISKHKLINRHFMETERLMRMEKETKALVTKLDDIQKGKLSSIPTRQSLTSVGSAKSLNYNFKKRENERIMLENIKMFERIISTRPQVMTRKMETNYRQSVNYKKLIQKTGKVWKMNLDTSNVKFPPIMKTRGKTSPKGELEDEKPVKLEKQETFVTKPQQPESQPPKQEVIKKPEVKKENVEEEYEEAYMEGIIEELDP